MVLDLHSKLLDLGLERLFEILTCGVDGLKIFIISPLRSRLNSLSCCECNVGETTRMNIPEKPKKQHGAMFNCARNNRAHHIGNFWN